MLIKNTNTQSVKIKMASRTINLASGEEELVTAEEVLDETLRDFLQVRRVSIVRPALDEEEKERAQKKLKSKKFIHPKAKRQLLVLHY